MHGAIWKLSAVATVVGFGLLAVVLQGGLGKGTAQSKTGISGESTTGEEVAGEKSSTDSETGPEEGAASQQSDAPPIDVKIKTIPGKPNSGKRTDSEIALLEPDEDFASEFPGKKTNPRSTPVATGQQGRFDEGSESEGAAVATPPAPLKSSPRGRRPLDVPAEIDSPDPDHNSTSRGSAQPPAVQRPNTAIGEDGSDPLSRSQGRPPKSRGRPNTMPESQEFEAAESVAQAPNTRPRAAKGFENESDDAQSIHSNTDTVTGSSQQPFSKRTQRPKLADDGDDPQAAVAPTVAQVVEEVGNNPPVEQNPKTTNPPGGTASDMPPVSPPGRRSKRPSAFDENEDDAPTRSPSAVNNRSPGNDGPAFRQSANGPGNEDSETLTTTGKRGSDPAAQSPVMTEPDLNLPDPQRSNATQSEAAERPPETPAVPSSRKRPQLNDDDEGSGNQNTNPRNGSPRQTTLSSDPQPIPKLERAPALEPEDATDATRPRATGARNSNSRPMGLDEDEAASQAPPPVPVSKGRGQTGTEPDIERSATRGRSAAPPEMIAGNPGVNESAGQPPTINPITGQPETPGRIIKVPSNNRGLMDDEQPGAAASENTATSVIAPRSSVIPAPMPGTSRGRARVTIEKVAPPTALLGQPLVYSIIIRNTGNASAKQVVVEDEVPEGVTMQGSIPQAEMTGRKLKWRIGSLEVGEEQKIAVKVVPTAEGPVGSAATVNFVHDLRQAASGAMNSGDGAVTLELQYPPQVNVGEMFEVKFRLTNRTNAPLSKLTIFTQLPNGLKHQTRRQDLVYDVESLGAGERQDVTLTLTASQTGPSLTRADVLTADETILESKQFSVDVRAESR